MSCNLKDLKDMQSIIDGLRASLEEEKNKVIEEK